MYKKYNKFVLYFKYLSCNYIPTKLTAILKNYSLLTQKSAFSILVTLALKRGDLLYLS